MVFLPWIVVFALWVYCIVEIVTTDDSLIRNMPKILWLMIVVFLPLLGSLLWLLLGRPEGKAFGAGSQQRGRSRSRRAPPRPAPRAAPPRGPEDSPDFLRVIEERKRLQHWEQELRRREEELRRREDPDA